jgi:hypothetical protein
VLDDGDGGALGRVELGDQFDGGVRVGDVVVAERLALKLTRVETPGRAGRSGRRRRSGGGFSP